MHKKKLKISKPKNEGFIKRPDIDKSKTQSKVLISLEHFDFNQSDSFEEWEKEGLLSKFLKVLHSYSDKTVANCMSDKFTIYGDFPPKDKTLFKFPSYIQEDAQWARIHINGEKCLIGHIIHNIFYIVFLDKKHSFWISTKKHT